MTRFVPRARSIHGVHGAAAAEAVAPRAKAWTLATSAASRIATVAMSHLSAETRTAA